MKRCFKCLCEKPLEAFYAHSRMKDGHLNKCKDCTKKDAALHRQQNLEDIRQYDRLRAAMPHRVAQRKEIVKRWTKRYPERKNAQTMLHRTLQANVLTAWPVCEVPDCNQKPEAHHPDYSRPLMVTWLCRAHHMQAHAISASEV